MPALRLPDSSTFARRAMRLVAVTSLAFTSFVPVKAQAKPAVRHIVEGTVINQAKVPVPGVVVYLENPKSLDVQSYLSDSKGYFHFSHISPQTDYEVWAEQNGLESKHVFISQFSSHVRFELTLKLTPVKKKKFLGIF